MYYSSQQYVAGQDSGTSPSIISVSDAVPAEANIEEPPLEDGYGKYYPYMTISNFV